jgi:AAA+ superfamily predicted ATPase
MMSLLEELCLFAAARVPLVAVVTPEERRAEERLCRPLAANCFDDHWFSWTMTDGMQQRGPGSQQGNPGGTPDPLTALEFVAGHGEPALFVFKDFHHHCESPSVQRKLRDLAALLPSTGKQLLFLGPTFRCPPDLEKEIRLTDFAPPSRDELAELVREIEGMGVPGHLTDEERNAVLDAALGLTLDEVETLLAQSVARDGALGPETLHWILAEKRQIVRRSGLLEFHAPHEMLDEVGGLTALKRWLIRRRTAFSEEARTFGLPTPRGVLLLGVQGCGKSLVAKAVAREWRMPLLRLDLGRVFGKYVGESEAAIRRVLLTAEAVAPAVLWIDELEKGFAGATAEAHDAGVSARLLGTFLTWMQERQKAVFVVATANQIRQLPPELLRKGRFDELFFVDLPTAEERREILEVHLRKRGREPQRFDLPGLSARTEGYTGAELEQLVVEGLFAAFEDGARELRDEDLLQSAAEVVPLAVTMKESLGAMRQWASTRARRAS